MSLKLRVGSPCCRAPSPLCQPPSSCWPIFFHLSSLPPHSCPNQGCQTSAFASISLDATLLPLPHASKINKAQTRLTLKPQPRSPIPFSLFVPMFISFSPFSSPPFHFFTFLPPLFPIPYYTTRSPRGPP